LIATSEAAFFATKLISAVYLAWLGIEKWRAPPVSVDVDRLSVQRTGLFIQGLLVNLTNPKAIIFVGALAPQFIDPGRAQPQQYLLIAATLGATDILVMSAYALTGRRLGRWLHDPQAIRAQNRVFWRPFCYGGSAAGLLFAFFVIIRGQRPVSPCVNRRRPEIALPRPRTCRAKSGLQVMLKGLIIVN
jgi:homoserine/homoserine lactone efflux protein